METEFIEIHWTSGSIDEARKISRHLVKERIVACAQIVPWIESVFMWDNKMDTSQESKIILKTHIENYDRVKEYIEQNSKYEIPEVIWFKIAGGNKAYLDWLKESAVTV